MAPSVKKHRFLTQTYLMRHLKLIVFILIGITTLNFWQSCKKGPEDPFFSLHSRLARVDGDWNITEYKVNTVDSLNQVIDSISFIGPCGAQVDKTILAFQYEWSFDKNGNFQQTLKRDSLISFDIINETPICQDSSIGTSNTIVTVQNWNFTSGVGDLKNKEQLYLIDPETKEVRLFDIIEFRNNEMKLENETVDPVTNEATLRQYLLTRIK